MQLLYDDDPTFLVSLLPRNKPGPWSDAEAYMSAKIDYINKNQVSVSGLAALWGWSRPKVERFLERSGMFVEYPQSTENIKNQRGLLNVHIVVHKPCISGNENEHIKLFKNSVLRTGASISKNKNVHKTCISSCTTKASKNLKKNICPNPAEKPSFNDFYQAYPKRQARGKAEQAWKKINPSQETFMRMIKALEWQCKQPDWLKDNGQYIPLPASWLNGKRWLDEPTTQTESEMQPPSGNTTLTAEQISKTLERRYAE